MALGRVALGATILLAPEQITARWLGEDNARQPAVGDLARGLAARDIAIGLSVLATIDDPVAGPRIQAGAALADAGDVLGTLLARKHLPKAGMVGTVAVAGGAVVAGLYCARRLARG